VAATVDVHLRPVTPENAAECRALQVDPSQGRFVASNERSLTQAAEHATFVPLAVYDGTARGYPKPSSPMIGFVMYEVDVGVGFIVRVMIDRAHQRKGCRLRLHPAVEMIATSHRYDNEVMASLCRSLGFVPWTIDPTFPVPAGEVYLRLARS
jgi:diamine N-acetyltransferase